jgi:Osmosensitive K+ channel His kinase sensor domain
MLKGLEVIPPRILTYQGRTFEELDAEALIARHPERALIDELAHTNIPGSRRAKRWEDVLDVLAEGVAVITTVNVQHLVSLNDLVARITGIRQQETVPDWVLDLADQVELVDMSPYALRRRMVHGNVYPDPAKAELALQRYFTIDNLTALRELALMRVANRVDEEVLQRWSKQGIPRPGSASWSVCHGRASPRSWSAAAAGSPTAPGRPARHPRGHERASTRPAVGGPAAAAGGRAGRHVPPPRGGRSRGSGAEVCRPAARDPDPGGGVAAAQVAGIAARILRDPPDPAGIPHRHPRPRPEER